MSLTEFMEYVPLVNLLLIFVIIPLYRVQKQNTELKEKQEKRIELLERSVELQDKKIKNQEREIDILVRIALKRLGNEALEEYIALTHKEKGEEHG